MAEFKVPSFLENQSVDDIHLRMMENLPDDIDTSEGGHPWNLTYPHALEKSYFAQYLLTEAIKLIFPMFSEDYYEFMNYHAQMRGLERKKAEHAVGEIRINGPSGAVIPIGSMFSTISVNDQPSVDFITSEEAVIGEDGTLTVPIRAVEPGIIGNVAAGTIILNSSDIDDLSEITNPKATNGGIEEESTEDLQERIMEFDETMDTSYGGSPADYKRWALSVNGTGSAVIVEPPDDTTPIIIILTDANGNPASDELCQEVYNYIMSPDDQDKRLAPVNDTLQVIAPSTVKITISATVELISGATVEQAKKAFVDSLAEYVLEATDTGEIKYTKVGSKLSAVSVINDYKDLTVNGGTSNIPIADSQVPLVTLENILFTEGIV